MLTSTVISTINSTLRRAGWPCERLQAYTNRIVCIQIPLLIHFKAMINSEGELQNVDSNSYADTTIIAPPFILPGLFTQNTTAFKQLIISGDRSFADELINIGEQINVSMIIEQDLSQFVGDMAAHRIIHSGKHLIQWQIENFDHISQAVTEYCTEENILLTKRTAVNQWTQDIMNLQTNIEKLEQRLDKLIHTIS